MHHELDYVRQESSEENINIPKAGNHSLDKIAQLVFRGEGVDDLVDDNHAVVHVQPRHGQAGGGLSGKKQ